MERREFIKASCAFCISAAAESMLASALSSCASLPVFETISRQDVVIVPISIFKTSDIHIIRVSNYFYDIALKKNDNGTYTALLLECTHTSNPLTFTGEKFTCSLHGSAFDQNGKVTHGPAAKPLQRLPNGVSTKEIKITLPPS
jgi:nitrite reductase/ring-hydroxylating ferredoxin subunit